MTLEGRGREVERLRGNLIELGSCAARCGGREWEWAVWLVSIFVVDVSLTGGLRVESLHVSSRVCHIIDVFQIPSYSNID
jgi:hypothetical protein